MVTQIKIYTFGKLLIERNGVTLENFISTKAMLLFVYLAMHPGPHTRKKLAAMLWSETSDEQALKNLRTVLSSIRQQADDALKVSHGELEINSDISVKVDASIFEEGFKKVFSSPGTLDTLKSMQALAALYEGEFLQNTTIRDAATLDEWITDKQRQFREMYQHLLFEIVEIAHKRANYEVGLEYAWKLHQLDPLWDAAQRQIMRLLAYTNRTNEALLHYERFVQVLDAELQVEPEPETTNLFEQIRSRSITPPASPALSSITLSDVAYVEPVEDIEIAQRMLNTPHCHLLTIFGISGIGKTTLATQLAFHRQHLYRDGACFVSLTIAQSIPDLLRLMAGALNINYSASMDCQILEDIIIDHLKPREMLLVLDNYEQLLPDTGFIRRVLEACPSVQVIVTSHMPLSLYREWLLPLRGLSVPDIGAAEPQKYEAVRLFELTAQRINPRFNLDDSIEDVIRICQLVDCLPLGIIIAAGWVQYMPPGEILHMMKKDLLQVEAVHHDIPTRHQSFEALVNAMLVQLSSQEQQSLMCLSIFEGSFSFNAALAVAAISPKDFKGLTDKCLVQPIEGFRYTVHSIVRQVFKKQLESSPDLKVIAERYTTFFQHWCDDFYAQSVPLHEVMHTIEQEQHNLWDVMGLSETDRQRFILHIAPAMTEYWINRGYHARGIIQLLEMSGNNPEIAPQTRIRGLIALARILERTSQYDHAKAVCEEVLALEETLNLPKIKARALRVLSEIYSRQGNYAQAGEYLNAIIAIGSQQSIEMNPQLRRLVSLAYEDLGEMLMSQGDYESASHYIEIAIRHWHEHDETLREAVAHSYLGIIALKKKEFETAYQLFESILTSAKNANNQTLIAIFSTYLGKATLEMGDYVSACALCYDALQIALQINRRTTIIQLMEQFSDLALYLNYPDISTQLFGYAVSMREQLNIPVSPHNQADHTHHQARLMTYLGDAFERNYQTGRHISLAAAVQIVLFLRSQVQNTAEVETIN